MRPDVDDSSWKEEPCSVESPLASTGIMISILVLYSSESYDVRKEEVDHPSYTVLEDRFMLRNSLFDAKTSLLAHKLAWYHSSSLLRDCICEKQDSCVERY